MQKEEFRSKYLILFKVALAHVKWYLSNAKCGLLQVESKRNAISTQRISPRL